MVGRRLNLWRLRDFDVTRLEAPEDVLLYHCVAPDNAADQRLVALAQVRQLAVVRDEDGQVVALPHAERAVANCLEAIRRARTRTRRRGAQAGHEPRVGAHLAGRSRPTLEPADGAAAQDRAR